MPYCFSKGGGVVVSGQSQIMRLLMHQPSPVIWHRSKEGTVLAVQTDKDAPLWLWISNPCVISEYRALIELLPKWEPKVVITNSMEIHQVLPNLRQVTAIHELSGVPSPQVLRELPNSARLSTPRSAYWASVMSLVQQSRGCSSIEAACVVDEFFACPEAYLMLSKTDTVLSKAEWSLSTEHLGFISNLECTASFDGVVSLTHLVNSLTNRVLHTRRKPVFCVDIRDELALCALALNNIHIINTYYVWEVLS